MQKAARMSRIRDWLDGNGLGKYADVLIENDVDVDVLPEISEPDLETFGFSFGDRKRFLRAARQDGSRSAGTTGKNVERVPEPPSEPERRQLTVMFCDMVGATSLSESMELEEYRSLLTMYQDAARKGHESAHRAVRRVHRTLRR